MSPNEAALIGAIPAGDLSNLVILDVGCNNGSRYRNNPEFKNAKRLIGVEPNKSALVEATKHGGAIEYLHGFAECLPVNKDEIDIYQSIVSLPYSDIPVALREAYRVIRTGGKVHLCMHDWRHQREYLWTAIKTGSVKRVIDHAYIIGHSIWFALTGQCFPRPWKRTKYESFQTQRRMRLLMLEVGFIDVKIQRTNRHFVVEARKP